MHVRSDAGTAGATEIGAAGDSGSSSNGSMRLIRRVPQAAITLLPAALTIYLAFNSGGFFAGSSGVAATALACALALWLLVAGEPLARMSRTLAVAGGALALLALWMLISSEWSDATGRAIVEFDRALLYALALLFFGLACGRERILPLIRAVAAALAAVAIAGLITRVAPDIWPIESDIGNERLSYPLSYWNGMGLVAVVAILLCLFLASLVYERRSIRVIAAALVPALGATLMLTFSRGAIAAGIAALVVFLLVARPAGMAGALIAVVPTTAVAMASAYGAEALAVHDAVGPEAVSQGHDVALVVALSCAAAALLRILAFPIDARLSRVRLSVMWRRALVAAAVALVAGGALAAVLAYDVPSEVSSQYDRFVHGEAGREEGSLRERLTDPGNSNRVAHWRVALDAFEDEPVTGNGAGTFRVLWDRNRDIDFEVNEAHSLYVETLAELGIVGLALLVLALGTLLVTFAVRARGPERPLYGALLAVAVAWMGHAGVDWDWELPAATLWLFVLGGAALASPAAGSRAPVLGRTARVATAIGLVVVAITPARMALSQRDLNASANALRRGDCAEAIDRGLSASRWLGPRSEPWEVIGYCDVKLGDERRGVRALENSVERDPDSWQTHYGLALVRGAAGLDPRAEAREAVRRNPRNPLTREAARRLRGKSRARWNREARRLPLPLQ